MNVGRDPTRHETHSRNYCHVQYESQPEYYKTPDRNLLQRLVFFGSVVVHVLLSDVDSPSDERMDNISHYEADRNDNEGTEVFVDESDRKMMMRDNEQTTSWQAAVCHLSVRFTTRTE